MIFLDVIYMTVLIGFLPLAALKFCHPVTVKYSKLQRLQLIVIDDDCQKKIVVQISAMHSHICNTNKIFSNSY